MQSLVLELEIAILHFNCTCSATPRSRVNERILVHFLVASADFLSNQLSDFFQRVTQETELR